MDTNSQEERNDSQRVGIEKLSLELHSIFLDVNIRNIYYKILVLIKFDKRGED
jgi:hypothetical protein